MPEAAHLNQKSTEEREVTILGFSEDNVSGRGELEIVAAVADHAIQIRAVRK
jgi:hypothetical protein